jgi:hypothetical protein
MAEMLGARRLFKEQKKKKKLKQTRIEIKNTGMV